MPRLSSGMGPELAVSTYVPGPWSQRTTCSFRSTRFPRPAAYQAHVRTKPDLDSVLLPIGSGVELSRKHGQGPRP